MTDHKGLPVAGYVPQSDAAVALVNRNKATEEFLLRVLDSLPSSEVSVDPRWVAIARTHFEQGFMALNRAIFRPSRIELPEDEANV